MMGLSLSQLFSGFFEVQPAKVVMLGLDAAGKTIHMLIYNDII